MSDTKERQFDYGPQRASWLFNLTGEMLLEAAKKKLGYHKERLLYWEAELELASKALKDSMEVRSVAVTGGMNYTAVFDQEKQSRVTLATSKRDSHKGFVERFAAWVAVLQLPSLKAWMPGTIDDAEYFGLGDNPPSSEKAAG